MSTNLSDKLNVPIDWTKILIGSIFISVFAFIFGIALKARFLLVIADLFIFGAVILALILITVSIIRKFSVKPPSK